MEDTNENIILKTKNLSIGYASKKAKTVVASNINIQLKQGTLVGLIGANGIGKSTLLKTLTHVQNPLAGNVLIHDLTVSEYAPIDLAKVLSLVLTGPIASKNLSVQELVALGRQPYTNWVGNLTEHDIAIINTALLFSSHEIDLAIQLCDNLIVMTENKVVSDEPSQLIANGTFETLFPKDLIAFDKETGRFRVKK